MALLALFIASLIPVPSFAAPRPADSDINYWVRDALRHDDRVDITHIRVTTREGIVVLSGHVEILAAKNYAEQEAKKINGVFGVVNKLKVQAGFHSDDELIQILRRRILNSPVIESQEIMVSSLNGKVTLFGKVASQSEKQEAGLLASEVPGVKVIQNDLLVSLRDERTDQEIKDDIVAALTRDVYLTGLPITVTVDQAVVTLRGTVGSPFEKTRAADEALHVSHVKKVDNKLTIDWLENRSVREQSGPLVLPDATLQKTVREELLQDDRLDASQVTIKVLQGHVTLDGSVPNHHQKLIAEMDARNVTGVAWVTNQLFARTDRRADWAIAGDVRFNLDSDFFLQAFEIAVDVKKGVVTLAGDVHSPYEKVHAEALATKVKGVRQVVNTIEVTPIHRYSSAQLSTIIKDRLTWNVITAPVSEAITVSVKGRHVTLTGEVNGWRQRREAGRVALKTDGIWRVDNRLTVKGSDYPWDKWYELWPDINNPLNTPTIDYGYPFELGRK